jgi:hypothetical protein
VKEEHITIAVLPLSKAVLPSTSPPLAAAHASPPWCHHLATGVILWEDFPWELGVTNNLLPIPQLPLQQDQPPRALLGMLPISVNSLMAHVEDQKVNALLSLVMELAEP